MIKTKHKDKWKRQNTRPTEVAAYGEVIVEAKAEGLSLSRYIRQCRTANARLPSPSVFDVCMGAVSQYEVKMRRSVMSRITQPLFAVEFGIIGDEG